MAAEHEELASALKTSIGLLRRRLRQTPLDSGISLPESAALARLDRGGPTSAAALAKLEQITPQSMGVTLATLEKQQLVERRPDPDDGRRAVISITPAGLQTLRDRRDARTQQIAAALDGFTPEELDQLRAVTPLLERLAERI